MRVDNPTKAAALEELLPNTVEFGNVVLSIVVVPANPDYTKVDLFRMAFSGNPAFCFLETIDDPRALPVSYCVFENEVVQYPADDISSYWGIQSTLYEDIAREIFEGRHDGIFFCTDLG